MKWAVICHLQWTEVAYGYPLTSNGKKCIWWKDFAYPSTARRKQWLSDVSFSHKELSYSKPAWNQQTARIEHRTPPSEDIKRGKGGEKARQGQSSPTDKKITCLWMPPTSLWSIPGYHPQQAPRRAPRDQCNSNPAIHEFIRDQTPPEFNSRGLWWMWTQMLSVQKRRRNYWGRDRTALWGSEALLF